MSDFIAIISNQRRLKAQLKDLSLEEVKAIRSKFDSVFEQLEEQEAERLKTEEEKRKKIAELKAEAARLDIDLRDLVDAPGNHSPRKPREPKYEYITDDGQHKTWTGQGPTPKSIRKAIEGGKSLEDHLIKQ